MVLLANNAVPWRRTLRSTWKTLPLGVFLCLAMGCGGINLVTVDEVVEKSIIPMPNPLIRVESFNGQIEMVRGEGMGLHIVVTKQGSGLTEEAARGELKKIDVSIEEKEGNVVHVIVKRNEEYSSVQGGGKVSISLPGDAKVKLNTSNGSITLNAPLQEVDVTSSNGSIYVKSSEGPVQATTSNGSIKVDQAKGTLQLKSSNGDVIMNHIEQGIVSVQTSNSRIKFTGHLAPGSHEFESSNGSITLQLPPDSSFTIDAKTTNSKAVTTFDMKKTGKERSSSLNGTVGKDPKVKLKLRTSNSPIQIIRVDE